MAEAQTKRLWKGKDAGIQPYQSRQTLEDHKVNWPWWAQCYQQPAISQSWEHYVHLLERSAWMDDFLTCELSVQNVMIGNLQELLHTYI